MNIKERCLIKCWKREVVISHDNEVLIKKRQSIHTPVKKSIKYENTNLIKEESEELIVVGNVEKLK